MPRSQFGPKEDAPAKGLVPRRFTPDHCRLAGCTIVVDRSGSGVTVLHELDRYEVPIEHLHDPDYNIWSQDVKPWLETFHKEVTNA